MSNVSVSVIIPAFNEETYIAQCLSSITKQSLGEGLFEVIVVDNGSKDRTVDIASTYPVSVISSDARYVGGVRNDGVRISKGEIVVFLDADCVVDFEWLARITNKLRVSKLSAMGGQYLLREDPSFYEKYWVLGINYEGDIEGSLVGGCIVTWKDDFNSVGGFPEDLTAGEDSAYSKLMTSKSGYVLNSELNVIHMGYPNTCAGFMQRQIWHSASFLQDIKGAFKERVFLILMFHLLIFVGFILALSFSRPYSPLLFLVWLSIPIIFSVKRVMRASFRMTKMADVWGIYSIDFLYMIAREWGILSSMFKKVLNLNVGKSRQKV